MGAILEIIDISKRFRLQHNTQPYLSIRDSFFSIFKNTRQQEEFYALENINFKVNQGESIGLIGKNGAGKSTLLKILSKITPPTSGSIKCKGRIASLLEVGTGFHPELTGRENIFLNGSILGMKRKEITARFDEIVDFSGVENFLDTPLKHYSSGMQLRLAFSVAAHLNPEILLIDEVLAVGDAEFQKKCMGKMASVTNEGRTILFVSHNMSAIRALCSSVIVLEHGKVLAKGKPDEMISTYLSANLEKNSNIDGVIPENLGRRNPSNEADAKFRRLQLFNLKDALKNEFYFKEKFLIKIQLELLKKLEEVIVSVYIVNSYGEIVLMANDDEFYRSESYEKGMYNISVRFDEELIPGNYSIGLDISNRYTGFAIDHVESFYPFKVIKETEGNTMEYPWNDTMGVIRPRTLWKKEHLSTTV